MTEAAPEPAHRHDAANADGASALEAQGLYDPAHEHDACGVGFVAHIKGQRRTASSSRA